MWLLRCLFVVLALSLVGCDLDAPSSTAPKSTSTSELQFAPGQLEKHFHKHGAEVGAKTQSEYLSMARALVARSGVATAKRAGDTLYYDKHSNEFAVVSNKGRLRTYFKPSQGEHYWNKQKQSASSSSEDEDD